jgi:Recombination endonuclease VII
MTAPACWAWPVTAADREQAQRAAAPESERERERLCEELLVAWHAGRCAICGAFRGDPGRGRLVWDHDHGTGYVRGLLCGSCNITEAGSSRPEFVRYRARPPVVILGVSAFYAEPSSAAAVCGPPELAAEALARWQERNDPARRR